MIRADLRSWSQEVLEVANPALNGLPACPYAREAWKKNKVDVVETDHIGIETIAQANKFENNDYELVVIASYKFPTAYQTHPTCLLYTSPSPRDGLLSRMPSSA